MFANIEQKNFCEAGRIGAASLHKINLVVISVMPEHIYVGIQVSINLSASKVL